MTADPARRLLAALVAEQAEDDGLWFVAATAPEGYLQQELRRLHAAVEALLDAPEADAGVKPLTLERLQALGDSMFLTDAEKDAFRTALAWMDAPEADAGIDVERLARALLAAKDEIVAIQNRIFADKAERGVFWFEAESDVRLADEMAAAIAAAYDDAAEAEGGAP